MVLGECCISVLILFLSVLTRFFLSFLGSTLSGCPGSQMADVITFWYLSIHAELIMMGRR